MAFGIGGGSEQRESRERFDQELKFERNQQALGQAGVDTPEDRDSELIRWQQEDEETEKACMIFRGKEKINNKWETIKIFKFKDINPVNGKVRKHYKPLTPMMNEQGINWFKGRLSPLVSKNIIMSNYDEPRILQTLKNDLINFIIVIGLKQKEFEIKTDDLPTIKRNYQNLFSSALFRSLQNGERKYLTQTSRRVESIISDGGEPDRKKNALKDLLG